MGFFEGSMGPLSRGSSGNSSSSLFTWVYDRLSFEEAGEYSKSVNSCSGTKNSARTDRMTELFREECPSDDINILPTNSVPEHYAGPPPHSPPTMRLCSTSF